MSTTTCTNTIIIIIIIRFNYCTQCHEALEVYKSLMLLILWSIISVKLTTLESPSEPILSLLESHFHPKTRMKYFPQFLKRVLWSRLKQGGRFLSNRKWAIVINSAGVSSMWLKWLGLYTENTQTRPKVTATLTTHRARTETASWKRIYDFS